MVWKIVCTILIAVTFVVGKSWRNGEMEIEIVSLNQEDRAILEELQIKGDHYYSNGRYYVTSEELKVLDLHQISYAILNPDLNKTSENFWKNNRAYYTCDEILEIIDDLSRRFPSICKKYSYGKSVQGKDLVALKISDNVSTDEYEPEVAFDGGIHGDEVGAAENMIRYAKRLVEGYSSNSEIKEMVDSREIWIYPMINPDGRERMSRTNANRVDLNRNWGYMGGEKGFSEPETQAARRFLMENEFVIQTSYHSGMVGILYPWCYTNKSIPDASLHEGLGHVYKSNSGYTGAFVNVQSNHDYPTTGETGDFSYGAMGTMCLTMEISRSKQPTNIQENYDKNIGAMDAMVEYSGYGIKGKITDSKTGKPVRALVYVNDYYPKSNDPIIGDYHRYLPSGSYTITVIADGYKPMVVENIVVQDRSVTEKHFKLEPIENSKITAYRVLFVDGDGGGITPHILGKPDGKSFTPKGRIVIDMYEQIQSMVNKKEITVYGGDSQYSLSIAENLTGPWTSLGSGTAVSEFHIPEGKRGRFIEIKGRSSIDAIEALYEAPVSIGSNKYSTVTHNLVIKATSKQQIHCVYRGEENGVITLFNTQGKMLLRSPFRRSFISKPLAKGSYIVTVSHRNTQRLMKIVVQ